MYSEPGRDHPRYAEYRDREYSQEKATASSMLWNAWLQGVDEHLIQIAGYNMKHAATMLGPGSMESMSRVMKLRFENEWSSEDVAAEIANEIEKRV